jgi:hypothetical protein
LNTREVIINSIRCIDLHRRRNIHKSATCFPQAPIADPGSAE